VRKLAKVAVVAGAVLALTATAMPAFAATKTGPSGTPFVVPADGAGNPRPFNIEASGFAPSTNIFVEQCDGVAPSTPGWDPTINCDLGTSPAPTTSDASGNVTIEATDVNHRFAPFKGESPQGLFNCLAPGQAAPGNGLPNHGNCQVRVSSNNTGPTSDQVFFTLQLPSATVKLSCVISGNMAFNKPLTNVPPKKAKTTKVKGAANIGSVVSSSSNCNNTNAPASATKYPVIGGSVKIKGALPSGRNCSDVSNPNFSGITLSFKWKGLKGGVKLSNAGKSVALVSGSGVVAMPGGGYTVSGPITVGSFAGSTVRLQLAVGTVSALRSVCNAGSLAGVNYSGASNISIL
jgi:hypothetical protein